MVDASGRQRGPDLSRLLKPRTVAVVGGDDAAIVIEQCLQFGYDGDLWAVNRKRDQLGGVPCIPDISELTEAPDLVFLGVDRLQTLSMVDHLRTLGAGSVICFAAGFAEVGGRGRDDQQKLVIDAGEMPLLGPNCYGLINAIGGVAVWPYFHAAVRL